MTWRLDIEEECFNLPSESVNDFYRNTIYHLLVLLSPPGLIRLS